MVNNILTGQNHDTEAKVPSIDDTTQFYGKIFGNSEASETESVYNFKSTTSTTTHTITIEEVEKVKLGWNNAPGRDGITVSHVYFKYRTSCFSTHAYFEVLHKHLDGS